MFFLFRVFEKPTDMVIAQLVANRAQNIADIKAKEAALGAGDHLADFVIAEAKKNGTVAVIVPLVEPEIRSFVKNLEGQGVTGTDVLYDKLVAELKVIRTRI